MRDCLKHYLADPTPERFRLLVDKTHGRVYFVALRVVGDPHLAEDVTQEVFLRLRDLPRRPEEVKHGLGFLLKVTASIAQTMHRSELRRQSHEQSVDELPEPRQRDGLSSEDAAEVQRAVHALEEDLQQCVVYKYYLGLGTAEIAKLLDLTNRAVQYRLKQASACLRRHLSERLRSLVLPAMGTVFLQTAAPEASAALASRLEELIASHPRLAEQAAGTGERTRGRNRVLRWRALVPALHSAVLFTTFTILILQTAWPTQGAADPPNLRVAKTVDLPAGPTVARSRPHSRALEFLRWAEGALERIDWKALEGDPHAPLEESAPSSEQASASIEVVDDDGVLVRSGLLKVFRQVEGWSPLEEPTSDLDSSRGVAMKNRLARRDLALTNPVTLPLDGDLGAGPVFLRIMVPGYPIVRMTDVELSRDRALTVELPSQPVRRLRLRNARTGKPVEDAQVTVYREGSMRHLFPKRVVMYAEPAGDGHHVLRGLDEGKYDLQIDARYCYPLTLLALEPKRELDVWMQPMERYPVGSLTVKVHGRGGALESGVEVLARVSGAEVRGTTDEKGTCRFEEVPEGTHLVSCDLPGDDPAGSESPLAMRAHVVRGNETVCNLGTGPARESLTVEVVDDRGVPQADVLVSLIGPGSGEGRTAADGSLRLESLPEGAYQIMVQRQPPGWNFQELARVRAGEENRCEVRIGRGTIRGSVRAPASNHVSVIAEGPVLLRAVELRADRRFEFRDALPGRYKLAVASRDGGFWQGRHVEVEVPEDGDPEELEVALADTEALGVEVIGADGLPVLGTKVLCKRPGGEVRLERFFSGVRAQEFGALVEPGVYELQVSAPEHRPVERRVEVREGRRERVEVTIER